MLNEAQKQAVKTVRGPVRIIAGAGTGKTRVLVHRIAHLVEGCEVKPWQILALTFTNKAAHEIAERLTKLGHPGVPVMTFHSLAARLLRRFWNPDFIIVEEEQKELLEGRVCLTFDELLTQLLELWRDEPEVFAECQAMFDHVMVDEYQDVNGAQIEIVRRLTEQHQNVCVVGDPDQTIYGWRGSVATSLQDFEKQWGHVRTFVLTQNYRNPPAILKGAEALIKHNSDRFLKALSPTQTTHAVIHHWQAQELGELEEMMRHLLEQKLGSHAHMVMADALDSGRTEGFYGFADIAILYRTQEQGKKIASFVARCGYPYQMSAPESFWARAEIIRFLKEAEALTSLPLGGETLSHWLREPIDRFIQNQKLSHLQIQNLHQLIPHAMAFDAMPLAEAVRTFLDEAALKQEVDNLIAADRINLLTLHAAKGLEFPVVMIVGLEEGVIPHKKSDLEEERRLLYVGMTRATRELHLLHAVQKPSRFLAEIGYENLSEARLSDITLQKLKRRTVKKSQMKLFS